MMKFVVKPLNVLIKLLIPAAIGSFMISQQPKLIAKAVRRTTAAHLSPPVRRIRRCSV